MHVAAEAPLAVVVVGDLGAVDTGGDEPAAVHLDGFGGDGEGHVVHGSALAAGVGALGVVLDQGVGLLGRLGEGGGGVGAF